MRNGGWCETTMRVAFFGRLRHTCGPTEEKQRPKCHSAGNDEQPKSPTPVRCMRVNLLHSNQSEWDGEDQPASQVSSQQNQKHGGDHGEKWVGTARCAVRAASSSAMSAVICASDSVRSVR